MEALGNLPSDILAANNLCQGPKNLKLFTGKIFLKSKGIFL